MLSFPLEKNLLGGFIWEHHQLAAATQHILPAATVHSDWQVQVQVNYPALYKLISSVYKLFFLVDNFWTVD